MINFELMIAVADLLNIDSLAELKAILDDELFQITRLFADQLMDEVDKLQRVIDQGDMVGINRQAHSLKGSSANMGATALAAAALKIEKAALAKDHVLITETMSFLPELADQTLSAMKASGYLRDA